MGDIAEALRRARDQEAATPDPEPEPREGPAKRPLMSPPSVIPERRTSGELAATMRAERLARQSDLESFQDASAAAGPVSSPPAAPIQRSRRQTLERHADERPRAERIALVDPTSPAGAASRRLAQQVKRHAAARKMGSIVITSPLGGDGKTTVSCNLAVSLARLDRSRNVVLVDLDLRRPRVAASLQLSVEAGVDELLLQQVDLDEALIETDEPGLFVLAPRQATAMPEPMLASDNLRRLIDTLARRFWMIVIDTPPVLAVSDASSVLDVADGCLLVVRAGKSPASSVEQAKAHLPADKVLGCCLNHARGAQHSESYYGYAPLSDQGGAPAASRSGEGSGSGDGAVEGSDEEGKGR